MIIICTVPTTRTAKGHPRSHHGPSPVRVTITSLFRASLLFSTSSRKVQDRAACGMPRVQIRVVVMESWTPELQNGRSTRRPLNGPVVLVRVSEAWEKKPMVPTGPQPSGHPTLKGLKKCDPPFGVFQLPEVEGKSSS